jgi:hypothetical protein
MTQELPVREQSFKISVFSFPEYDNAMLQEFYDYWSEPTPGGKKMRFELEKTWDIKRRLNRWYNNNKNWNNGHKLNSTGNGTPKLGTSEARIAALKAWGI